MAEVLRSVGLDVGTTSTQMVLSRLTLENRAGSFAVPEMEIQEREILYKSPIHFTPLLRGELVDAAALKKIVDEEYRSAGITKEEVDTGAIIITGETSRKENAAAVLEALSEYAGEFVVATAGPDLESSLAARGAGALEHPGTVLHMDIGGGTSNLALIRDGQIQAVGCLNVGGRLLKIEPDGKLTYVSPVVRELFSKQIGDYVNQGEVAALCGQLTWVLEAAAGLREEENWMKHFFTRGASPWEKPEKALISFSGGVAECIRQDRDWLEFGDMGPELGRAIRGSRLCRGKYTIAGDAIRATVIGAGCHSAQLSGSTVFHQNMSFPLKNLPVVTSGEKLRTLDGPGVLALPGVEAPDYEQVAELAETVIRDFGDRPVLLALQADQAKAVGQQIALRLGGSARILCIDRVKLGEGDYLDVGSPVGPAFPVVIKTLILNRS